jgi:hypothetical protein
MIIQLIVKAIKHAANVQRIQRLVVSRLLITTGAPPPFARIIINLKQIECLFKKQQMINLKMKSC